MFGWNKKKTAKPVSSATSFGRKGMEPSVLASNVNVLGSMVSDGLLDIDGQVDGNVRALSVTVRPNGRITGDLIADEVLVHGQVDGLIIAKNVVLFATSQVNGTVMHESLSVEDGASVNGKLKRTESSDGLIPAPSEPLLTQDSEVSFIPPVDANFVNDNDEPQSEKEIKILENLRLIS